MIGLEQRDHCQLRARRANDTGEIEERETARAERRFDRAAEHPQRKHVERDVREVSMQKRVREDLPRLKSHAYETAVVELRRL
jgi:hypothetical protein